MAGTKPKGSVGQKKKDVDEIFCSSCGSIIKKEAEICVHCGVRNKENTIKISLDDTSKPRGSVGWLVFWIIIFWPIAIFYGLTRRWK